MRKSTKWGINGTFLSLFLAMVIYMVIPISEWYITGHENQEHLLPAFEKEIAVLEPMLSSASENLVKTFDTLHPAQMSNRLYNHETNHRSSEIVSFVFKYDSIVYWNSNREIFKPGVTERLKEGLQALYLQNGWYACFAASRGSWKFISGILIKNEYSVRNLYLDNRFSGRFTLPESVEITLERQGSPVFTSKGTYLCSLVFDTGNDQAKSVFLRSASSRNLMTIIYMVMFLSAFGFLMLFFFRLCGNIGLSPSGKILLRIILVSVLLILRGFQFWFKFPSQLYQTELFSPAWYSSSVFLPSLGDLVVNAILLFAVAFFLNHSGKNSDQDISRKKGGNYVYLFVLTLIYVGFTAFDFLVTNLVINSSFPLNFQNIASLNLGSVYGLLSLVFLCGGLYNFSESLIRLANKYEIKTPWLVATLIGVAVVIDLAGRLTGIKTDYSVTVLFFVFVLGSRYFHSRYKSGFSIQHVLLLVFFYAIFTTFILNQANSLKETEKVNLLAVKLTTSRNPVTEDLYEQLSGEVTGDTRIGEMVFSAGSEAQTTDSLDGYLKRNFFNDYWRRYNIQVTLCKPHQELRVQPQGYLIECDQLFRDMIHNFGESTATPGLYFLDYGYGKEYYLSILNFADSAAGEVRKAAVYIEFTVSGAIPDPGYPGLLLDQDRVDLPDLSEYSYALYQEKKLMHAAGDVSYKQNLPDYTNYSPEGTSFPDAGLQHFHFSINEQSDILISRDQKGFLAVITPFSYLFVFFALIALIITGLNLLKQTFRREPLDLRVKLQLSLTGVLIITMLTIGIVQIRYIGDISEKKNRDDLREKAYSIQTEVQYKFSMEQSADEIRSREPENFLIKLSNVFFTDVNLYDTKGFLISSSRPKIFREKFISDRISPGAYQKMILEHSSMLIHEEAIGSMSFASVYLPMHNDRGQLLGYVNLPYFARQDELKREISSFLVTFINIYILLILFGAMISILIANYITSPLALLAGKMSLLRLGRPNERIAWKNNDEIGRLVSEYNRMIDELERSAAQLALTERESAWRQMARQVAHEIKNPLTPMKLSAQFLQKSWNEKAPDMDQRISRFTGTLVEQIDTLAAIASDFSDFARMPQPQPVTLNMAELIQTVLAWYPEVPGIQYIFDPCDRHIEIKADRAQLTRALTNLVNNAIQAIGRRADGIIRIGLTTEAERIIIQVSDNGTGIPSEMAPRIFQPDFTTKTGGMGLGLAIVKAIVNDMNGDISFNSDGSTGTTFIIKLPVNQTE